MLRKTALSVVLIGSIAHQAAAATPAAGSAAPKTSPQARPAPKIIPGALNQAPAKAAAPPRIQIIVSPDGKRVTIKILSQDGDVALHGVRRAQPQNTSAVAARSEAVTAPAKGADSNPKQ